MKQGWEIKKLGEVCELYQPKTISTKEMVDDGDYTVFGANGVIGKYDKYNHEEPQLLITCRGATCGFVNISEPKSWITGNAMVVRPIDSSAINLKFLEYLFRGGIDLSKTITGAAQPQITRQSLAPVTISYPKSLPEQQRIVSILNECFSAIAKAKTNAEQNLKNAKELFESYLQGVFENKGEGWEEKTLGEICEYDKTPHDKSNLPYVGLEDIQSNSGLFIGTFEAKSVKSTTFSFSNEHVLYGRLRPYLNKVLLPDFEGHCSTEIFPIKPKKNVLDRTYLFHWLIATETMKKINATWTGATLPRANMNTVLDFKLVVPPLKTQQSIVHKLDALSTETKKLESIYQQKINDLEELKKSVLQKAFAGELSSPERASSANEGHSPSKKSPARA